MVDAIKLLTRSPDDTSGAYDALHRPDRRTRRAGRVSWRVRSSAPISSTTWADHRTPEFESLRSRYEAALELLAPDPEPITQRGEAENIGRSGKDKGKLVREKLKRAEVYDRLEALYKASVAAGTAEVEKHWYSATRTTRSRGWPSCTTSTRTRWRRWSLRRRRS